MKPFYCLTVAVTLSGCQLSLSTASQPTTSPSIISLTQKVQNETVRLHQAGAVNELLNNIITPHISANSQRVTVDWDGDAVELLSQLAHQRGLTFAYTGVRLPLPVTVHVQNVTFESLLRIISTQIDWRAQLDQQSAELRLYFMLPLKKGKLA
uniref:DotD/TraH family lipoprotein n=1 Tax=Serratia proteamaculans TaxID=28151 RepID=UPI001F4C10AC|nr:DotD/TraH family lipoprotein [Serratia proteamaculans]ULG16455.1 TraH [Serratia proteamaculans]